MYTFVGVGGSLKNNTSERYAWASVYQQNGYWTADRIDLQNSQSGGTIMKGYQNVLAINPATNLRYSAENYPVAKGVICTNAPGDMEIEIWGVRNNEN